MVNMNMSEISIRSSERWVSDMKSSNGSNLACCNCIPSSLAGRYATVELNNLKIAKWLRNMGKTTSSETQSMRNENLFHDGQTDKISHDHYDTISRVSIQSLLIESPKSPGIYQMAETLLSIQTSSFQAESDKYTLPLTKIPPPIYGIMTPSALQTPPGGSSPESGTQMESPVQDRSPVSVAEYEDFKKSILIKKAKQASHEEKGQLMVKAAAHGDLTTMDRLVKEYHVHPGIKNNLSLVEASKAGHFHIVDYLMNNPRVNPTAQKYYAVKMAVLNGHLDILNRLLESPKVDPAYDQNYALRTACRKGHVEIVKVLLKDKRVDPTVREYFALRKADINGHLEIVDLLLSDTRTNKGGVIIAAIKHNKRAHKNLLKKLGVKPKNDIVSPEE